MEDTAKRLQPIDKLEVRVLVDNVTDNLSSVPDNVGQEIQTLSSLGMKAWAGDCMCCAHHGLSLVITAHIGSDSHCFLFDAGPEEYTIKRNGEKLGIRFNDIEAAMLSHGHWDHGGGLVAALRLMRSETEDRKIPFFMHPDMFCRRGLQFPNGFVLPMRDVPTERELTELGADVHCTKVAQTVLDDCFFISGEIPRITPFEAGLPNHVRKKSPDSEEWEPDPWIMDERYLAVNVKGKGMVVFSACSHAVARMADFGLDIIVPAHCTGFRAVTALVNAFGDKVVPSAVGRHYQF